MIETEGVVVKVEDGIAFIQAQRQSSCGGCAKQGEGCGTSTLVGYFDGRTPLYQARNPLGVKVGERVVIGVENTTLLRGVLAIYLPPLLLLVAGAVGGHQLADTPQAAESYAMLGALVGLAAGFFGARLFSARMTRGGRYQPVILSRKADHSFVNFYGENHRKC
jgi:sigma-E factor negative regulatory protein RseC